MREGDGGRGQPAQEESALWKVGKRSFQVEHGHRTATYSLKR
jgi:hypothetical protein